MAYKTEQERDAGVIERSRVKIINCFDRIEKELDGREYLAGTFSLADIAFMPNNALIERFDIPVDPKFKNMLAWMARLKSRPSFAESAT